MVDERAFWSLIDRSRETTGGDPELQERKLYSLLRGRSRSELEAFAEIYFTLHAQVYRWDCRAAGYVTNGGLSDDGFSYFRDWLISRGRDVYERTLADPDSLADVDDAREDEIEAEGVGAAISEVYSDMHGGETLPGVGPGEPPFPAGERWEEEDLAALLPRLSAKAGW
jgi:hypothetical protein